MVTKDEILEALKKVNDPELHKNLVELDMVRNIQLEENTAQIEIALTTAGCPLKSKIKDDIVKEVTALPGVTTAHVEFRGMTPDEKQKLEQKLGKKPPQPAFTGVKVIAIGSGKGGVGKSTVAVNLAFAISRLGYDVGIMDADIYGFSVPRLMGLIGEKPKSYDGKKILPLERNGVKMISAGSFAHEDTPLIWRGPILSRMLEQFMHDVHWGKLDYLLIDLPPGTGDAPLTVMQKIPHAYMVVVTTPQASASHVASRIGFMAETAHITNIGVIENMSYFQCPSCGENYRVFGQGETDQMARALDVDVLGRIPLRLELRERSDQGEPPAMTGDEISREIDDIARKLVEKTNCQIRN